MYPARSAIIFHIFSQTARFSKKKNIHHKICFNFPYKVCHNHFPFYEQLSDVWWKKYIGLYLKFPLLSSDFSETSSRTFHDRPSFVFTIADMMARPDSFAVCRIVNNLRPVLAPYEYRPLCSSNVPSLLRTLPVLHKLTTEYAYCTVLSSSKETCCV